MSDSKVTREQLLAVIAKTDRRTLQDTLYQWRETVSKDGLRRIEFSFNAGLDVFEVHEEIVNKKRVWRTSAYAGIAFDKDGNEVTVSYTPTAKTDVDKEWKTDAQAIHAVTAGARNVIKATILFRYRSIVESSASVIRRENVIAKSENTKLKERNAELEARLAKMEALLAKMDTEATGSK